jgi:hypothetical protein
LLIHYLQEKLNAAIESLRTLAMFRRAVWLVYDEENYTYNNLPALEAFSQDKAVFGKRLGPPFLRRSTAGSS